MEMKNSWQELKTPFKITAREQREATFNIDNQTEGRSNIN